MSFERDFGIEKQKNIVEKIGSLIIGIIGWIGEMTGFKKKGV